MMPTLLEIREAEREARLQRLTNARMLAISDTEATPDDISLAQRVIAAAKGDGTEFDRALANSEVNDLFNRGVLFFRDGAP